ncbi:Nicotinamidase [Golovinomyces cichoracearum]|uniref:nicotinamidase n=1 Tax=Golovinomyces cichoracearum TaxID=62708 RepID=A0A420IKJ6_9PEZI|nr:Nicotinamidase [Golovinomyces cichoracearum]
MSSSQKSSFNPALIIVDLQEDFCPPNGSLAVPNGREIIDIINKLLDLPFILKVASKDWHPETHISFASNQQGKRPFSDVITLTNPQKSTEKKEIKLWPNHCVAGTWGAELVAELNRNKIDLIIEKGTNESTEMYSVFYDIWGNESGLTKVLKEKDITDICVVGLAFDYCVRETAKHAAMEGFKTVILKEATRSICTEDDWGQIEKDLQYSGVRLVDIGDDVFSRNMDRKLFSQSSIN